MDDGESFTHILIAPAVFFTLFLAFTKTRRRLFLGFLQGRPGLIYPMDLTTKSDRLMYICAHVSTTSFMFGAIWYKFRIIHDESSEFLKGFIIILSAVAYGLVYLPVFASLTVDNAFGHFLGAAYTWMLTLVALVRLGNCDASPVNRFILVLWNAPYLMSNLILSCNSSCRFYHTAKQGDYFRVEPDKIARDENLENIKTSVPGIHVRHILSKPPETRPELGKIARCIRSLKYKWDPGFRYGARLLATLVTGFVLLYQIAFWMIAYAISIIPNVIAAKSEGSVAIIIVGSIVSMSLTIYNLLRHMVCYRRDMHLMYRGELQEMTKNLTNTKIVVGAMRYAGYHVIQVVLAFIFHAVLLCGLGLMLYTSGLTYIAFIWNIIVMASPVLTWWLITFLGQKLLANYVFLQEAGKVLALDNRRWFFIFAYFIFFMNILVGIAVFTLRFLTFTVTSLLSITRLDQSCLPQAYTRLDPAYMAYVGFLKLECAQTHPVMLVFLRLLLLSAQQRREVSSEPDTLTSANYASTRDSQEGGRETEADRHEERRRRHRNALVFRWQLLYTLINNPSIRLERNGYIQKLGHAQHRGVTIPKSDVLLDPKSLRQLISDILAAEADGSDRGQVEGDGDGDGERQLEEVPEVALRTVIIENQDGRGRDRSTVYGDVGRISDPDERCPLLQNGIHSIQ